MLGWPLIHFLYHIKCILHLDLTSHYIVFDKIIACLTLLYQMKKHHIFDFQEELVLFENDQIRTSWRGPIRDPNCHINYGMVQMFDFTSHRFPEITIRDICSFVRDHQIPPLSLNIAWATIIILNKSPYHSHLDGYNDIAIYRYVQQNL